MASYPAALWVPSHIIDGTILEQSLFDDVADEIDAITLELGVLIHGTAGSLAERIDLFMGPGGGIPQVKLCDLADVGERRRMRAGVTTVSVDDITKETNSSKGTIVFSPPLQPLRTTFPFVHLSIQTLDADDLGSNVIPVFISAIPAQSSTTAFQYRVSTGSNSPPADGSQFILHWMVWERTISSTVELP